MNVRRGTYVLALTFCSPADAEAGALGPVHLEPGTYCYVGSAMGGLDQRLSRHLSRTKTLRWHIDHLTVICDRAEAWESYPRFLPECELARLAEECGMVPAAEGFGCSDCRCRTHLFRAGEDSVQSLVSRAGLSPYPGRQLLFNKRGYPRA